MVVVPRDGQVASNPMGDVEVEKKSKQLLVGVVAKRETRMPWHVYDLKRGRPSAVVEAVECADGGDCDEEADGTCVSCEPFCRAFLVTVTGTDELPSLCAPLPFPFIFLRLPICQVLAWACKS